jgi:MFS transporter, ACS family, hexuronate transporter
VGAVVAPPLIALMMAVFGDSRWVFFATGAFGVAWAAVWWKFYAVPSRNRMITPAESSLLNGIIPPHEKPAPYRQFFRYRPVWGLMAAKFLSDSTWFFFIFWLPKDHGQSCRRRPG